MLLVTGITGHSGRYFLQELIKNKYKEPIRCIVRKTSDTSLLDSSGLKIEKIIGNLEDQELINKAMVGVDIVMHIYNIHYSLFIVQAAIKNNVKEIILVHTTGIYSKFKNASQEYKKIEKKIIKFINSSNCETNIIILRPTMIYGDICDHNMSKLIKIVDKFPIIPVINNGYNLIQPVNARDLGKAYYTLLTMDNNVKLKFYDLSGKEPIKMINVLKLISDGLDKKTTFFNIPLGLGIFLARILKSITFGKIDIIEKIQRMGENRSYSHEDATNDFKYDPMSFKIGMNMEISEYLSKKIEKI